ncbi:MAG TPA: paraquat-inducible protein A [Usitatibacter sp.]|nr:paraquat-inducible protein A [Usitatibacter sp.]
MTALTAREAGLVACLACHLVSRPAQPRASMRCPRCRAPLHSRKPRALGRTWAFLIAAFILYIPANVLPVMDSNSLFMSSSDTILSGVRYLWKSGSPVTASIIFFASILEPMLKLVGLTALALSVQHCGLRIPARRGAQIYRMIHVVGRWSMTDLFAAGILAALVQSPTLAEITVGPGALAFGLVVVLTMLASLSFDPRCLYDTERADCG